MPHLKILHIGTNKKFESDLLNLKSVLFTFTNYLDDVSLNDLNHFDLLLINAEMAHRSGSELQLLERCDILSIYYREGSTSKWADIKTGIIEIIYNNSGEFYNSLSAFINELELVKHDLNHFNHLYRHHPLPLLVCDQDFIVRYASRSAIKIFDIKKHSFYVPNINLFNLIKFESLSSLEFSQAIEINKFIAKKIVTVKHIEKHNFTFNSWLTHYKNKSFYAITLEQNNEFSNVYEIDKLNKIISQQDWFQQLSILKQLNDPFLIINADLKILFSNPSFNLMFNYVNDYTTEILLDDIFINSTTLFKTIKNGIYEITNNKKICSYQDVEFKSSESEFYFDLIFVPNTNQQNANYLVIFRDETFRNSYKKQLLYISKILLDKKINFILFNEAGVITLNNTTIAKLLNIDLKINIWTIIETYCLINRSEIINILAKYNVYQKHIEIKKNYSKKFFNFEIEHFIIDGSTLYSINLNEVKESNETEKKTVQEWIKEFEMPLINLIDDLIFYMDKSGKIKFINKNAEYFFSNNTSSITENSIYDFLAMPDRQHIEELISNSKLGKKSNCDVFFKTKENKFRCFSINSAPLFSNEILDTIICTARDIHLQKELELEINRQNEHLEELVKVRTEELEQAQKHYRTLFNGSGDFIYLLNKENKLIMINDAGLKILKPNIENSIGQNYKQIFASDYSQYLHYAIENVFFSKAAYSTQHEMAIENDSIFFHTLLSPIFDINNEIIEIVGISRDITEIINLQGLLDSERERILQADKLATIGELATGIAHEINQPLNHIKLALSMNEIDLDKGLLKPEKLKEEFSLIYHDIDRASNIVKILREFGRNESHHLNSSVNINDCIRDAAIMFNYSLTSANIDYSEELLASNCMFFGGKNRLEQVIINLVNNARDSLENSELKKIKIKTENKANSVIINIEDSGKGIPDEIVEKIFNPFFTSKEVGKGTGVGLSISVNIIQSFGGSLTLSKNTKSGVTFSIELPIRKDLL